MLIQPRDADLPLNRGRVGVRGVRLLHVRDGAAVGREVRRARRADPHCERRACGGLASAREQARWQRDGAEDAAAVLVLVGGESGVCWQVRDHFGGGEREEAAAEWRRARRAEVDVHGARCGWVGCGVVWCAVEDKGDWRRWLVGWNSIRSKTAIHAFSKSIHPPTRPPSSELGPVTPQPPCIGVRVIFSRRQFLHTVPSSHCWLGVRHAAHQRPVLNEAMPEAVASSIHRCIRQQVAVSTGFSSWAHGYPARGKMFLCTGASTTGGWYCVRYSTTLPRACVCLERDGSAMGCAHLASCFAVLFSGVCRWGIHEQCGRHGVSGGDDGGRGRVGSRERAVTYELLLRAVDIAHCPARKEARGNEIRAVFGGDCEAVVEHPYLLFNWLFWRQVRPSRWLGFLFILLVTFRAANEAEDGEYLRNNRGKSQHDSRMPENPAAWTTSCALSGLTS